MHLSCVYSLAKPCEVSAGIADCFSGRVQSFRHYARSPPAPFVGWESFTALAPQSQQHSWTRLESAGARPAVFLSRSMTTLFKAWGLDGAVALLSFVPAVTNVSLSKNMQQTTYVKQILTLLL